jgi:hypothetical protein
MHLLPPAFICARFLAAGMLAGLLAALSLLRP